MGLSVLVLVGDDGDDVRDSLKVRAMGVIATRRLAVWAVRRSWKGIVVSYSFPVCLIVDGSMDGRRG